MLTPCFTMLKDDRGSTDYLKEYAKYSSLIVQMILIVGIGFGLGVQIDKWFKFEHPIGTVCLTIVVTLFALILLFKTLMRKD